MTDESGHHTLGKTFLGRPVRNAAKLTDDNVEAFLDGIRETGNLAASARSIGVSYQTVKVHYDKNDQFRQMVEDARQDFVALGEEALKKLAIEGITEKRYKDGELVYEKTTYDVRALELLLKRHAPELYGNRQQVDVNVNSGVLVIPERYTEDTSPLPLEIEYEEVED